MQKMDRMPSPEEFALNILGQRDWTANYIVELQTGGNLKEAKSFERYLERWDKMIADYGLGRYRKTS